MSVIQVTILLDHKCLIPKSCASEDLLDNPLLVSLQFNSQGSIGAPTLEQQSTDAA